MFIRLEPSKNQNGLLWARKYKYPKFINKIDAPSAIPFCLSLRTSKLPSKKKTSQILDKRYTCASTNKGLNRSAKLGANRSSKIRINVAVRSL